MAKYATFELEEELFSKGYRCIVGVDEAGRGPGAGPVVAAAVCIPRENISKLLVKVRDSKKVSEARREELRTLILETCHWGIGAVDNKVIDEINILNATKLAMRIAINRLPVYAEYLLIDGTVELKDMVIKQQQIIKGDEKVISIAAASILAKTERDDFMRALDLKYPQYRWNKNKGYLTKDHIEAIRMYGPSDLHRLTFRKVGDVSG